MAVKPFDSVYIAEEYEIDDDQPDGEEESHG